MEKRKWTIDTTYTRNIGARLPNGLYDRLKRYCRETGETITDMVIRGLDNELPTYTDTREEARRD